jgi:hypothetical protein
MTRNIVCEVVLVISSFNSDQFDAVSFLFVFVFRAMSQVTIVPTEIHAQWVMGITFTLRTLTTCSAVLLNVT